MNTTTEGEMPKSSGKGNVKASQAVSDTPVKKKKVAKKNPKKK